MSNAVALQVDNMNLADAMGFSAATASSGFEARKYSKGGGFTDVTRKKIRLRIIAPKQSN